MTERREKVQAWTRPSVRGMKPYYKAPLEGNPLRLDQNTNLWGPNPVLERIVAPPVDQYPTRDADDLMAALATTYALSPDHFVAGNGSDEALDLLTKAFTDQGQVLAAPSPSYSLYPFYARLQDLTMKQVPLRSKFQLDVDGLLATEAALTVVPSPNNPTGNAFATDDLQRLIEESDGIVVIDEAYAEYADHSFIHDVDDHDNLVVMRTFSKAYGLAGLRIGYLAANPDLVERLRLVKPPFNLNTYSEAVAVAALHESAWMQGVVADTIAERERMAAMLKTHGLRPHPSDANFILCHTGDDPGRLNAHLRSKGILARTFPGVDGLEQCIRFTVGMPEHTDQLGETLEAAA